MINSFWEEQNMNQDIYLFHEKQMEKMDLPQWIKDIKCPFCDKELHLRCIRNIQLCLNTRNFGEIAIEVLCDRCSKMDTLYFRENCENLKDFCNYLVRLEINSPIKTPKNNPVIEEDMYKMQYNNLMNKMMDVE